MGLLDKRRAKREAEREERERFSSFANAPVLDRIRPRERYVFHSDYFEIDGCVATILTYTHNDASIDQFGPFWGINRIPRGVPSSVVTINLESVSRMSEGWINAHQSKAEGIAETDQNEQGHNGSISSRGRAETRSRDLAIIGRELNNGASYLNVQTRLLVKAPDLDTLDIAVERIERYYTDVYATISVMTYPGDQRHELSTLFAPNIDKRGKGMYATSPEYAGSFNLVTHGLEDVGGEFVGMMHGDVNVSCVIFDVDAYRHHTVIASEGLVTGAREARISDVWGSKIGQACLMNGHRVVHILMSDTDMSQLGPTFDKITTTLDLNSGDLNMFEMFGDVSDEMGIFAMQMQKLILMAEQAYECTDADRAIIRGSLEEIATKFYIHKRMWRENAAENREALRVVGIPHKDVPKLHEFVSYLDTLYQQVVSDDNRDPERMHAYSVIRTTFKNLLTTNSDLFDICTSDAIDSLGSSRRTIYDFSNLMRRGKGVAMAQLVNVIGLALSQCGRHDTVIIHGAQNIDAGVRDYISTQFSLLWERGGRVVMCYDDVESAIRDASFNRLDSADYTIFGNMTDNAARRYQEALGGAIPGALQSLLTSKSDTISYIRRGFDNVVFHADIILDPKKLPKKKRRR